MLSDNLLSLIGVIFLSTPIISNIFGIVSHDKYKNNEEYEVPRFVPMMSVFSSMIPIIMVFLAVSIKFIPYGLLILLVSLIMLYSTIGIAGKYYSLENIRTKKVSVSAIDKPTMIASIILYIITVGLVVRYRNFL